MSPSRKRRAVQHLQAEFPVSERRACLVVGQPRATQRYRSDRPRTEAALIAELRRYALEHPRYGYRRVTRLLRRDGWKVNQKKVQRLRRSLGLHVRPKPRIKRKRGSSENACHRRRPEHPHHVWSLDFLSDQTEDGRPMKILAVIDEFSREALAIKVARSITGADVRDVLERLIWLHQVPVHLRSDNGPEFVSDVIKKFLDDEGVNSLFIAPGAPWENGYCESFNARFRDEFLDIELFADLKEAKILAEAWRVHYNTERPHSALNYMTPREFAESFKARNTINEQSQQVA